MLLAFHVLTISSKHQGRINPVHSKPMLSSKIEEHRNCQLGSAWHRSASNVTQIELDFQSALSATLKKVCSLPMCVTPRFLVPKTQNGKVISMQILPPRQHRVADDISTMVSYDVVCWRGFPLFGRQKTRGNESRIIWDASPNDDRKANCKPMLSCQSPEGRPAGGGKAT